MADTVRKTSWKLFLSQGPVKAQPPVWGKKKIKNEMAQLKMNDRNRCVYAEVCEAHYTAFSQISFVLCSPLVV